MAYATVQDMIDRFGESELLQLSDKENTGAINVNRVELALERASSFIDAELGFHGAGEMFDNKMIVDPCCDIARAFLYDNAMPDVVDERFKKAIEYLRKIRGFIFVIKHGGVDGDY